MAAEHDTVLNLFDSFWFEHEILASPKTPSLKSSKSQETIPQQIVEKPAANNLCRTPSFMVRSFSDQCLSSKHSLKSQTHPPKSVLFGSPKLQPLVSGKEYLGFPELPNLRKDAAAFSGCGMRRKSLSELEFEEVKGFMDLGFVFSDEDKDSTLVSIIPGLQRLGGDDQSDEDKDKDSTLVSRPYLSEAWSVMEEKRKNNNVFGKPLMNWRIESNSGTEMEIKDQLRCWAHTVASTVV